MEQHKIERINELTRISRERALTEAEAAERQQLRSDYLAAFRGNFRTQLNNTVVQYPDGTKVTLREAAQKKR